MQYEGYKVQATLNEIDGLDHSGKPHVGPPAIFGMNFQTISTAEKLPASDGLAGGYLAGGAIPGPLLSRGLNWLAGPAGQMAEHVKAARTAGQTPPPISPQNHAGPPPPRTPPTALRRPRCPR